MNQTPDAGQNIITRGLPKTGQTILYLAGDDGDHQAGWWLGRLNANNRTRFIAKTIGGDDIVLDRATGLMWAADGNAAGCNNGNTITWANAIPYANGLTFATFSDWRIPNIKELLSLADYSQCHPAIDPIIFPNTALNYYWSSTTLGEEPTAYAWAVQFDFALTEIRAKTDLLKIRCVRKGV